MRYHRILPGVGFSPQHVPVYDAGVPMPATEPPSDADVLAIAAHRDELRLVIDGHKALDAALTALIAEHLLAPDLPELARLKFTTRLDLVIGLGMLDEASRAGWLAFNRLRNRFVHRMGAAITREAARELYDALSPRHRHALSQRPFEDYEDPFDLVDDCLAALFAESTNQLTALRDAKTRDDAWHREVVTAVGGPERYGGLHQRAPSERDERVEAQVAEARRQRRAAGQY